MTLQRKLIRNEIAKLLSGRTAAGTNVVAGRILTVEAEKLPALSVFTESEQVSLENQTPRRLKRGLRVVVEVYASANDADPTRVDNQLDDLCQQVEDALGDEISTFNEIPAELLEVDHAQTTLESVEIGLIDSAARPMAGARLAFGITYYTRPGVIDPSEYLAWLGATVKTDLPPEDGQVEVEDTFELDQ
ncbi:MAG: hypothetical protein AAFZ65_19220 [Planctomycetota bacterium]